MASHVLYESEALHLGHHLLKSGDSSHISISKVMHFVQMAELLNARAKGCTKDRKDSRCKSHCYSILLYSKTTTIPNKKSSCSSATVNQAILLGHWWFMWDGLVLLPCYALNWYLYLVHLEDTFQITAGIQTILYDMVLAFPPSACGPAIHRN